MKFDKNKGLLLVLVGILLVVLALPTGGSKEEAANGSTEMEKRLEKILMKIDGVGKTTIMITYDEEKQIEGVVVVAEEGEDGVVVQKITEVVETLFPVSPHKIKVIKGY